MYCLICYLLIILQLLVEIIVPFHDFIRCLLYALSYFRRVLAREYTLISNWFGVRYKFFHKNHPLVMGHPDQLRNRNIQLTHQRDLQDF